MSTGARGIGDYYLGSLVRHAEINAVIWKSWRCQRCGEKHPPERLVCGCPRADSDDFDLFRGMGYGLAPALGLWAVIGLITIGLFRSF